jgi:hypothetical protein
VVAEFDGGALTSDAGGLLLGAADRGLGLVGRLAGCFRDARDPRFVEHSVATLVGQRVFGIALGYEDLNDHDELRHDPLMAVLAGKLEAWRGDCAPVAGKSTLNRLELSREIATRYHKISHDPAAIEALFVDLFLEAHAKAPKEIILDLDATDDPLHGLQEGRFFHGYYDCYCYLPLYVFCGRHLLAAKLRPSNIDGSAGAKEEIARIVGGVEVENDLSGRLCVRLEEEVDEQGLDRRGFMRDLAVLRRRVAREFQPVQRRFARRRRAVAAPSLKLARQHRHQRVVTKLIVIVEVFVAERDAEHTLADERGDRVLDEPWVSRVAETSRKPPHQIQTPVRSAQQQAAGVGRQRAAIELGDHRTAFNPFKRARFCATLRLHRAILPNRRKSFSQNNFCLIRRPDALPCLRNAG